MTIDSLYKPIWKGALQVSLPLVDVSYSHLCYFLYISTPKDYDEHDHYHQVRCLIICWSLFCCNNPSLFKLSSPMIFVRRCKLNRNWLEFILFYYWLKQLMISVDTDLIPEKCVFEVEKSMFLASIYHIRDLDQSKSNILCKDISSFWHLSLFTWQKCNKLCLIDWQCR